MIFDNAVFIKPDHPFKREFSFENLAPIFRKKFKLDSTANAKLLVCGLGIGYYYINGKKVSDDLFTVPFSNYLKTLWYHEYDVSHLLNVGENVITIFCGNGFFNETLDTKTWGLEKALWRDVPKVILRLEVEGKTALVSDSTFKCLPVGATYFNQFRRGEYFNANLWDENITSSDYDDSEWKFALKDVLPPTGTFRKCNCQPIRECEILPARLIRQTGENKYLFGVGKNISGYIRLTIVGQKDDLLTIRYAEDITDDFRLEYRKMDLYSSFLQNEGFQTDKFICSGEKITWSPKFTYHGFRYIEIDGITDIGSTDVKGVFVHQAVDRRTEFECSDEFLNKLFEMGVTSTYSNMFYCLTDCPTREKMGWTNDFMASAEQLIVNFEIENLYKKYQQDIFDAMMSDGSIPGILPSAGWNYRWELGPIGDGILFELPYRLWLHTGDKSLLKDSVPYFDRYFRYFDSHKDEKGMTHHGLGDWSGPKAAINDFKAQEISLINAVLEYYFYGIATLADKDKYSALAEKSKRFVISNFIDKDGKCIVNTQCSVSMLIYYNLFEDLEPLKNQLKSLVEEKDFHLMCGMVGIRRLLSALSKCGLHEYAYKVLTCEGFPGYRHWTCDGATSLYERWEPEAEFSSHNHHMFSDYMSWMIKNIAGVSTIGGESPSYVLDPVYFKELDFARLSYNSFMGRISVEWERKGREIILAVEKDENVPLYYKGELIKGEKNTFKIVSPVG